MVQGFRLPFCLSQPVVQSSGLNALCESNGSVCGALAILDLLYGGVLLTAEHGPRLTPVCEPIRNRP